MQALDNPQSGPYAVLTGSLYLVIAAAGFFSILWVPMQLVAPGDPLGTAQNILDRRGLFQAGVAGDVIMMTAEVLVSVMLFGMFRRYGPTLALAALVSRLLMAAVMAAMLLFSAAILVVLDPVSAPTSMDALQRAELADVLRRSRDAGVWVWQVFFALHLVLLSVLVARSGIAPKLLALGLGIGGTGYLVDSIRAFAFPDAVLLNGVGMALLGIVTLSEIGFALWLVLRGRSLVWRSPVAPARASQ